MVLDNTSQQKVLNFSLNKEHFNLRLDQALALACPQYSRSKIKTWIEDGMVKVDGVVSKVAREKVTGLEDIELIVSEDIQVEHQAQNIALNIVYEDDDIIIINKPKNLVVHPGAGNSDNTILNALLYHYPEINKVPRAGIVHRLDKDTTGLMVVAKNIEAQNFLVAELQARKITREYEAVVFGILTKGGAVRESISRHPTKRTAMAIHPMGKPAVTHYRVMEYFRNYTRLRLRLETGRTHQIRVHMSHIGHPLLGDVLYGGQIRLPKKASPELVTAMREYNNQALHAVRLKLIHPRTKEEMDFTSDLPPEMEELILLLRQDYDLNNDDL